MRYILFRGKSATNGRWRKGDLLRTNSEKFVVGTSSWCVVNPDTIGQYTGIDDKNGAKVFEGDIVKAVKRDNEGFIGVVTFESEYGCYMLENSNIGIDFGMNSRDIEVIGNKFDNPELLEA